MHRNIELKATENEILSGNEQELLLENNKEYHLFFSYSSQDESLIIPILEILESAPYNLKCCIDRRDFILGETTIDNIYHALNHSMGTVFFLTPQFLESDYCHHEKQTAFTMYMERECRVIPVILKPCLVPDEFRNIHYIDESVPEVIADKIFKCLKVDPKDFKKHLPLNPIQAGQRRINGNKITLHIDQMLKGLNKKNNESFLTSHQKREFQRIGIKVCDSLTSLINMVVHIPANKPHYTNHRKKYFLLSSFLKGLLIVNALISIISVPLVCLPSSIEKSLFQRNSVLFGLPATVVVWGIIVVPFELVKRYIDIIWSYSMICKVNKLSVLDKECCFGLKVSMCSNPTIWAIKYDISSCKNFLEGICTKVEENQDTPVNFEGIWNDITESSIFKRYFQKLADETLPHVNEERHIVLGDKVCFCQYLDLHSGSAPYLKFVPHSVSANNSNSDDIQLLL